MENEEYTEEKSINKSDSESLFFGSNDSLIVSFVIPIIIMIIIFAQRGIFPFGENSFLRTDMYHQYAPFFSEFKHKLSEGGSLFYSWDIGMGVNFSAIYAYYLASPLNWLIILCPKTYIIEFMTYMIVLKIGLAGLSFAYFLKKHSVNSELGISFFAICYALSGYMAAYSWNIMWLDCIILLPIICLGLERLVQGGKGLLYAVALGLSIASNYYISIMICIFMVIYFAMQLIMRGKTKLISFLKSIGCFALYSLLAGGIAAAVLLPEIYALSSTASSDISFPKNWSSYFSIIAMLARHMAGVDVEIGLDHWPNIYCGTAVFILILLYLVNKKIALKEKIVYMSVLLFFYASFSINVFNYIWHGLHYPNSLPCRQSFIYVLLILYMCFRVYDNLDGNTKKQLGIAYLLSSGFVLLCQEFITDDAFHFAVYYGALVLLALYAGVIYLKLSKKCSTNIALLLFLTLVSVENAINTTATSITTIDRANYIADNADVKRLVSEAEDGTFFRYDKVSRKTKDDGAWMNFRSISLFSSTANADVSDFFKKIGCESSTNAYSITGATPLIDSLFSVKYGIYSNESANTNEELMLQSGSTYLYKYPYTLPLGYMVDGDLESNWMLDFDSPADVQNDLCELLGASDVLVRENGTTEGSRFSFTASRSSTYYVQIDNSSVDKVNASIGDADKNVTFDNLKRGYLIELGYLKQGESVSLLSDDDTLILDATAYSFDYSALEEVYNKLSESTLDINSFSDTHIEGTVYVKKQGALFLSVSYDKGWKICVDGQERAARKYFDTFMAIDLSEGSHEITLDYTPQGLKIGILISIASVAFLIILTIAIHMYRIKHPDDEYGNNEECDTEYDTKQTEEGIAEFGKEVQEEIDLPSENELNEENNLKSGSTDDKITTDNLEDISIEENTSQGENI